MSAAARSRAERYGPAEFLASWAGVVQAAVEHKPLRTKLDGVSLELEPAARGQREPAAPAGDAGARLRPRRRRLRRRGRARRRPEGRGGGRKSGLDAVELGLAWVERESGAVTELPLSVKRAEEEFRVRAPRRASRR